MSEFRYLEDLTFRVDLSKAFRSDDPLWSGDEDSFDIMVLEEFIAQGLLVQVVPKQRTWRTLHGWAERLGKKIGVR